MKLFATLFLSAVSFFPFIQEQGTESRVWNSDSQPIEGVFESFENGIVKLADGSSFEFQKLPFSDQQYVMDLTGWGRVWEDKSGKHRTLANLVQVAGDAVVLEKVNGKQITVLFSSLSNVDQKYAEARRTFTDETLPETFRGKVIGISDGDTLTVLLNRRPYKIRIDGIDAPEAGQDYGMKAKQHLADLIHGKQVSGEVISTDRYGRNICNLTIDENRIDHEMLRRGLAWHYLEYSTDPTRTELEGLAKSEKLNIWSEPNLVPPWEWRRWGSAKRKEWAVAKTAQSPSLMTSSPPGSSVADNGSSGPKAQKEPEAALIHWLNTKSDARHNSSCRWFKNTKSGRMCKPKEGNACGECGG